MTTISEATKFNNGKDPNIEYPIRLYDEDGNEIYYENSGGFWCKSEYKDGNQVYREDSNGYWWKSEYEDGNEIYCEDSTGFWCRREYDDDKEAYYENSNGFWSRREYEDGVEVYYENSDGCIEDNREPVDMTIAEVRKELGKNIRIVG